jgi:hypothetical protein
VTNGGTAGSNDDEEEEEHKCPIDWKRTTVDEVVELKEKLRDKNIWVVKMLLPHVIGRQVWKDQV